MTASITRGNHKSTTDELFPADQTIQRYPPPSSPGPDCFPTYPLTTFQSSYPLGFGGCMFCGATRPCLQRLSSSRDPWSFDHLLQASVCAQASLSQETPYPHEILPAKPGTPLTQSFPVPAHLPSPGTPVTQSFPVSAHLPPPPPALTRPCLLRPRSSDSVEKRAQFMVQIITSFSMHTLRPRPALALMPIAIDNGLPILPLIRLSVVSWTPVAPLILVI